jgi:hypothetical protein
MPVLCSYVPPVKIFKVTERKFFIDIVSQGKNIYIVFLRKIYIQDAWKWMKTVRKTHILFSSL